MNDSNAKSQSSTPSVTAGPAVSLRFNGAGNPNKVRRGGNLEKLPAADALDASGKIVPNVHGNYTLQSGNPGVTVTNNPGPLNGKVSVTNVQSNMTIQVLLTTMTVPAVSGIYTVMIEVIS